MLFAYSDVIDNICAALACTYRGVYVQVVDVKVLRHTIVIDLTVVWRICSASVMDSALSSLHT